MTIRWIHTVPCVTLGGCTPFLLMFACSDPHISSFLFSVPPFLSSFSPPFSRYVRWYAADGNASFVPAAAVLDVSICCASFDPSELLDVFEDRSDHGMPRLVAEHPILLAAHVSVCVCVRDPLYASSSLFADARATSMVLLE